MQMPDQGTTAFRYAIVVSLGLCALVAGIAMLLVPLGAIEHLRGMVTQLCVTAVHLTSDVAALGLVLLVGPVFLVAAASLVASAALQRRALRSWAPVSGAARRRASMACRMVGIDAPTVVFRHDQLIACSRGIATPSIWISDAAVAALDDAELAAVLAHEGHHCTRRDPAKRQVLEVLARALFAFPIVGAATSSFRRLSEFAADDAAARATSTRITATALLRFAGAPGEPAFVQFGSPTTIGERVQRLIGVNPEPRASNRRAALISAGIATIACTCLGVVAILPGM